MSYQALYRKWRPDNFEDVKGQDHIVTTLKNQIRLERVGHAYLFCGTRGTGKTTVAKIFAKAVNCESPVDGSPCNQCAMCRAINEQRSMNVIEIDAASNNGVDNIREIRDEVAYSPAEGRYKVYIIDEVHMLSIGAFNALLKTLEEPPSYVIFILATTEAHKIPITILSRCQRYDFHRITMDTIADRLRELAAAEKMEVDEDALRYVARMGDGSMRDALSLLDQCVAFYIGEKLTYDKVLEVLGAVDTAVFGELLGYILEQDTVRAITLLEEVIAQGRELTQFTTDFTWYLRNLLMLQSAEDLTAVVDVSAEQKQVLLAMAAKVDMNTLIRYIRIFSELSNKIRYATQKRVLVEVALIKLCKPMMEQNYDAILNRLVLLERKVAQGVVMAAPQGQNAGSIQAVSSETGEQSSEAVKAPKAVSEDLKQMISRWKQIVADLPVSMGLMLKDARVSEGNGNQLVIGFSEDLKYTYFMKEENRNALRQAIMTRTEKDAEIVPKLLDEGQVYSGDYIDPANNPFQGMDIIFEDE